MFVARGRRSMALRLTVKRQVAVRPLAQRPLAFGTLLSVIYRHGLKSQISLMERMTQAEPGNARSHSMSTTSQTCHVLVDGFGGQSGTFTLLGSSPQHLTIWFNLFVNDKVRVARPLFVPHRQR
jgi:hypothetical protein